MRRYRMSEKNKTVSAKLSELNELVAWFESDEFTLEQALEKFKQAELLAKEIEGDLSELKHTITVLKKDFSTETSS